MNMSRIQAAYRQRIGRLDGGSLSAFSLVELLIIIGIIIVLLSLLFAALPGVFAQAKAMKAVTNAKAIGQANILFGNDFAGKINGVGDWKSPDDPAEKGIVFRLAPYLSGRPPQSMTWDEVWPVIRKFNDPNVPDNITWLPDTMRFAWAFNDSFTIDSGSGPLEDAPFVRLNTIVRPSQTLYAMGGIYTITRSMANDPTFASLPTTTWRIGPYVSYKGSIPAVFLDGRAELLKFPFDPDIIAPGPKN